MLRQWKWGKEEEGLAIEDWIDRNIHKFTLDELNIRRKYREDYLIHVIDIKFRTS